MRRVGVISDTHGLLRPEAMEALRGSDLIVHAGDVGDPEILDRLAGIAPVTAVRGNVDRGAWALDLPETATIELDGVRLYVIHDIAALDVSAPGARIDVVIFGHSHVPSIDRRDGRWYFNPGSAGPRRFRLPMSVGRLTVAGGEAAPAILELEPRTPPART